MHKPARTAEFAWNKEAATFSLVAAANLCTAAVGPNACSMAVAVLGAGSPTEQRLAWTMGISAQWMTQRTTKGPAAPVQEAAVDGVGQGATEGLTDTQTEGLTHLRLTFGVNVPSARNPMSGSCALALGTQSTTVTIACGAHSDDGPQYATYHLLSLLIGWPC